MTVSEAFGDTADLIAHMDPEKVMALKASTQISERVEELLERKKNQLITTEESNELERFLAWIFLSVWPRPAPACSWRHEAVDF